MSSPAESQASKPAEKTSKDTEKHEPKQTDHHDKSDAAKNQDRKASTDSSKKEDTSKMKDDHPTATKEASKTDDNSKQPKEENAKNQPSQRRATLSVPGEESDSSEDLVRSAMQKARRLSIRTKGRPSIVSQSVLPQAVSAIAEVNVIDTIEANNIWDLAVKMKQVQTETADPDEGQLDTTLIVLGGEQAGKSTLVARLLDSDEAPRKTLGLDYTYARRAGAGIGKDVCQIWELGGGTRHLSLLDTPVSADRLSDTACLIVVDLSRPETILPTVEQCCDYMQKLIEKKMKEAAATGIMIRNLLKGQLDSRLPADHPDRKAIRPLLVPLALVGSKYDKFQPMDTTDKKVVVEAMRWAAHRHFAHLMFFSSLDGALGSRARELLSHLAFRSHASKRVSTDVQKPVQVAAGEDRYKAIGGGNDGLPLEVVQSHVSDKWPPPKEKTGEPDDPARDALFAEPEVDSLRVEKAKELDRLRQDLERRAKMAQERAAAEKERRAAPLQVDKEQAAAAAADFLERHHSALGNTKHDAKDTKHDAKDTKHDAKPPAKGKSPQRAEHKAGTKPEHKAETKTPHKAEAKTEHKAETKSPEKHDAAKEKEPAKKAAAHAKPAEKAEGKPSPKK